MQSTAICPAPRLRNVDGFIAQAAIEFLLAQLQAASIERLFDFGLGLVDAAARFATFRRRQLTEIFQKISEDTTTPEKTRLRVLERDCIRDRRELGHCIRDDNINIRHRFFRLSGRPMPRC